MRNLPASMPGPGKNYARSVKVPLGESLCMQAQYLAAMELSPINIRKVRSISHNWLLLLAKLAGSGETIGEKCDADLCFVAQLPAY
jgi:hypothetical protein